MSFFPSAGYINISLCAYGFLAPDFRRKVGLVADLLNSDGTNFSLAGKAGIVMNG